MIFMNYKKIKRLITTSILTLSLIGVMLVTGSCVTAYPHISQDPIICTSTGLRLTSVLQTSGKRIESFIISGRRVKLIRDRTGCVTLKIDGVDFHSWHHLRPLIKQQFQRIPGLEFCLRQVLTQRRCSSIRWYQYPSIIHFSLSPYRTGWSDPRLNYPTRYRRGNSRGVLYPRHRVRNSRSERGSTPRSTGRTRETTRTMGRNSNSSSMMNRGSGRNRTTSSITGESRRRVLDSVQR